MLPASGAARWETDTRASAEPQGLEAASRSTTRPLAHPRGQWHRGWVNICRNLHLRTMRARAVSPLQLYSSSSLVAKLCPTLETPWDPTRVLWCLEFSRQEYCSGLPFLTPGYLPNLGIKLGLLHCRQSPTLQTASLSTESPGKPQDSIPNDKNKV